MFNNTYVRGGNTTNNNNIEINSVSGTLVKNYKKSFFFKCKEGGYDAEYLFDPQKPRIEVKEGTKGCFYEWAHGGWCYFKNIVVLQTMILANGMLLNEVMWQDDFDEMFVDYGGGEYGSE